MEITDPEISVEVEGFSNGGPRSYILNKIEYTKYMLFPVVGVGKINYIRYAINTKNYCQSRMFHTRVKAIHRIGPHNQDVISVIIGSLLGDCYGNRRYVEGTRFCYRQSIIHKDYLFWLYNFYYTKGYCSNLRPRLYTRILKKNGQEIKHYGYEFNTYTFRSFDWINKMFYKKGQKVISREIEKYITPLALAIWIMDDGGSAKPGLRIATNCFKLKEVQFLAEILKKKFHLNCTIQEVKAINKHSIYIKGSSIPTLRQIVLPFLHASMNHKLGL